jgi:hypothetical protein
VNSNITSKFILNQLYKINIESYEKADSIDSFSLYTKKLSSLPLSTNEKNSMSVIKYLITNIMIKNPVICAYDSLSSVSQKITFCEGKLKKFKQERNLDLIESFPIFVNENTITDAKKSFSYFTDEISRKYKNFVTNNSSKRTI